MRAYGRVHIEDAFIQTAVARKELTVEYTLHNADRVSRTVAVAGQAELPAGGGGRMRLATAPVILLPGETRMVRVTVPWTDLALYWPDRPVMDHLTSRVVEPGSGNELDRETRRFGFREITIQGNQFYWNGVRANLYGDYQVFGDPWYLDSARWHSPALGIPSDGPRSHRCPRRR